MDILYLIVCGLLVGFVFLRLKVPAGMMLGAMVSTMVLVNTFGLSAVPTGAKYIAQVAAGVYIGCSSSKEELWQLRTFYKPVLWLTGILAFVNLVLGFLLWFMGYSDLLTCFMCAVPGGISDVTLIAADMGADPGRVLLIHLCRLVCGIGIFPTLVNLVTPPMPAQADQGVSRLHQEVPPHHMVRFLTLIALSSVGAYAGVWLDIPAGCLLGAMVTTFILRFSGFQVVYPKRVRMGAQVVSGLYIGCLFDPTLFQDWPTAVEALAVTAIVLVVNAYVFAHVMQRCIQMPMREGMLMLTPAGASDMALISADIGVHSPRLILLQLYRFILASTLFPQLLYALVQYLGY